MNLMLYYGHWLVQCHANYCDENNTQTSNALIRLNMCTRSISIHFSLRRFCNQNFHKYYFWHNTLIRINTCTRSQTLYYQTIPNKTKQNQWLFTCVCGYYCVYVCFRICMCFCFCIWIWNNIWMWFIMIEIIFNIFLFNWYCLVLLKHMFL